MKIVTIDRVKVFAVPGTNPLFAWRWNYIVQSPEPVASKAGQVRFSGDRLDWARRIAGEVAREIGGYVFESF